MLKSLSKLLRSNSGLDARSAAPVPPVAPDPFVADSPVTDPLLDKFKRLPFAERIAKTLALRSDPSSIVVLVHGKWGEGKTTVLGYVFEALCRYSDVVPIRFNPWRFTDETELLLSFFATVATELDKSPKTSQEKISGTFRDYGSILGEIRIEVNGVKVSGGGALAKFGEKLSAMTLEEKRERIEGILKTSGKRLVVFLDGIDRLDKGEIRSVFKLLKLTADFAFVSYVLAFDRDVVAEALGDEYGTGETRSGYQYLEKIIQVNLNLPLADPDVLVELCLEGVEKALRVAEVSMSPEQEKEFQQAFLQYIAPELRTPRLAKPYANAVAFTLPLLANEINPVDLLLLEAIKFLYPEVHEDIRKFPSVYTGDFGWDLTGIGERGRNSQERLNVPLTKIDTTEAARARNLLTELFPQLGGVFRNGTYGNHNDDSARREQRVSSMDYLRRYLTCSIPATDLSDREIDEFLHGISRMADGDIEKQYRRLLSFGQEKSLLLKIHARISEVPENSAKRLALVAARLGSLIPGTGDIFRLVDIAGLLIRRILERVGQDYRKDWALALLSVAEPLSFAAVLLDCTRPQRGDGHPLFSDLDRRELVIALGTRIASRASTSSLISGRAYDFARLLVIWQEAQGSEPVKEHLRRVLAREPDAVAVLMRPFFRSWAPDIDRAEYDFFAKLVDPADLMGAFESSGLLDPTRTDEDAKLAQQFAAIYRTVQAQPAPTS
jgi:hypothetical protein